MAAASLAGYGHVFREHVAASGWIPQVSVITGTSAGGASYSPALTDFVVMTAGAAMFLTGPGIVEEVTGERVGKEALGGPRVHARNGVCHFDAATDAGAIEQVRELLAYLPQNASELPPAAIPKHRQWIPDRLNFFVVGYNTQKVRRDELPKDYRGFLDAKWKGRLGIEATDSEWMATLVKRWGERDGMAFFRQLAEMRPDVRKGHVLLAELIAAGEIPVGLTVYNSNAESFKRKGAPIDWIPVQPVVARPQGIAILKNAPHREAAQAFADFVLSPEGQELFNSMGRVPVSTKVKTHLNQFEYTLVDPATVLDEQDKWTREWDKLFIQK